MDAPRGLSRSRAREHGAALARARRDTMAVAVLFGGVVPWAFLSLRMEAPAPGATVLLLLAPLLVGAAAVGLPGSLPAALASRPSARALGHAFPAAALILGVGIALAYLLSLALDCGTSSAPRPRQLVVRRAFTAPAQVNR
jgi:hypothetical protein